jgi:predicted RNA methylase
VTVTPVNDPPTAVDDLVVTMKNTAVTFNALSNDADVDGDQVNVSAVGSAAHGTVFLQPNIPVPVRERKITYTPAQDFTGTDEFTYTITDGALTATAKVMVRVVTLDVNGDGAVDVADIMLVAGGWRSRCGVGGYEPFHDFDGDCDIDIADIMRVVAAWR